MHFIGSICKKNCQFTVRCSHHAQILAKLHYEPVGTYNIFIFYFFVVHHFAKKWRCMINQALLTLFVFLYILCVLLGSLYKYKTDIMKQEFVVANLCWEFQNWCFLHHIFSICSVFSLLCTMTSMSYTYRLTKMVAVGMTFFYIEAM